MRGTALKQASTSAGGSTVQLKCSVLSLKRAIYESGYRGYASWALSISHRKKIVHIGIRDGRRMYTMALQDRQVVDTRNKILQL